MNLFNGIKVCNKHVNLVNNVKNAHYKDLDLDIIIIIIIIIVILVITTVIILPCAFFFLI